MNQINGQTFLLALTAISDGGRLHDSVVRGDRHRPRAKFWPIERSRGSPNPPIPRLPNSTFARLH